MHRKPAQAHSPHQESGGLFIRGANLWIIVKEKYFVRVLSCVLVVTLAIPTNVFASSHREAPITALDRTADVTDWYAFCSFGRPGCDRVTMIINVDPFLEPSNGPNYFPFDPN